MEFGAASEGMGVQVTPSPHQEYIGSKTHFLVRRWDEDATSWVSRKLFGEKAGHSDFVQPSIQDFARLKVRPYSVSEWVGNLITNAGYNRLMSLLIGGGGQAYDSTHTSILVGTATGAASYTGTDIGAATGSANRYVQPVTGAGSITSGSRQLAFTSTFATGNANFAWQEFGTDQTTAAGVAAASIPLLNWAISSQGTKASGQTWTATETFTFS